MIELTCSGISTIPSEYEMDEITDPLAKADFEHYCAQSGFDFLESYNEGEKVIIRYKFNNIS